MIKIRVDLHCHSHYAGGASQRSLESIAQMQKIKGLNVAGTGDCLHPAWLAHLQERLVSTQGLFSLRELEYQTSLQGPLFCLQSEIVLTMPSITKKGGRVVFHLIILFPSFECVIKTQELLCNTWKVKNTIGRPFVTCQTVHDVTKVLEDIKFIDPSIEFILAHALTKNGILGARNNLSYIDDAIPDANMLIKAVETGISATPSTLNVIPELNNYTLVSFSDSHSEQPNRLGREYTVLNVDDLSYQQLTNSIREDRIEYTFEMNPAGGRYFLTGHSAKRHRDSAFCLFGPMQTPRGDKCPICRKTMDAGVYERATQLSKVQEVSNSLRRVRKFIVGIPLTDAISSINKSMGQPKSPLDIYLRICNKMGSEASFWEASVAEAATQLEDTIDPGTLTKLLLVKDGQFSFSPPGGDGNYGTLSIGHSVDYENYRYVPAGYDVEQLTLFGDG